MVVLPSDVQAHPPQFMPFLSNSRVTTMNYKEKSAAPENKVKLYLHTAHKYQPFTFNRHNRFCLHWQDQIYKPQFNPYTTTTINIGQKYL